MRTYSRTLALVMFYGATTTACGQGDQHHAAHHDDPNTGSGVPLRASKGSARRTELAKKLRTRAQRDFGVLKAQAQHPERPLTEDRITLGRTLYYDKRLSKNHDVACESCHLLAEYGVDGEKTSKGHREQRGDRNAPTVYNAAFHFAQFWDGRAADVEEQAKGPILNPVEMAMPDEESVLKVLNSIPAYAKMFAAAFPEDAQKAISYENMAIAIGAFERKLVTPGPFDKFLEGDDTALSLEALEGLQLFMDSGCTTCHIGPNLGGTMYQKLGSVKPYPSEDQGRFQVTKNEADKQMFKVPSLRNVAKTGPYFHDGSLATLAEAVAVMVKHQTPKGSFSNPETAAVLAFLNSLTGELPEDYIKQPPMPPSGPDTPAPDPS